MVWGTRNTSTRNTTPTERVNIPAPGAPAPPRPSGLPTSALATLYGMKAPEIPAGMMAGQVTPPVQAAPVRRDPTIGVNVPPDLFGGRAMPPPPPLQAPPAAGRPVMSQPPGAMMPNNLPQYAANTGGLFPGRGGAGVMSPAQRAAVDAATAARAPAFAGQQVAVGLPQANAQLPAMPQAAPLVMGGQQAAPVRREPAPVMVSPQDMFGPRR